MTFSKKTHNPDEAGERMQRLVPILSALYLILSQKKSLPRDQHHRNSHHRPNPTSASEAKDETQSHKPD